MTEGHDGAGTDLTTGEPRRPTPAELDAMSTEELARLAAELDDVTIVQNQPKWPIPGTRAERRAERAVAAFFGLSAVATIVFLGAFLYWPHDYVSPLDNSTVSIFGLTVAKHVVYSLYTPVIGTSFGLSVLGLGLGVIAYVKKFFPIEVSVQQRHDGPSDELARKTIIAQLVQAGKDTGIARRKVIKRSAGAAAGLMGVGLVVGLGGGLIRNPWEKGDDSPLLVTGWRPNFPGEKVYLRRNTGVSDEISLIRPEDLAAGTLESAFPFRESERGNKEALVAALKRADNPVMLIRLRPGATAIQRAGQEDFHYGDYYAYSKVCTHLGCPTSLYETQTNRILCPCHQSQFLANEYARPVFGPATRALPQLPITVDERGYFLARSDFTEPIGPAYWERKP
jgi:ubiquinol-cytochrome c reductase iron-sulfur subunit